MKIHPKIAPHQNEALQKMKDGCILWGGVGSGKSRVGLAYYAMTEQHEDIYVITTARKRDSLDWEREASNFAISKDKDLSIAGALHVDSWNNIQKYVDVKNAFFIFDEQRLVGAGAWSKAFLKIARHNRWIMLSATPGDTWMDYVPVFIANGFYRNRTEFKAEHVIQAPFVKYFKVERYVGVQRLVRQRNQILIHMPYDRSTTRHSVNCWVEFDDDAMFRVAHSRWHVFEDRPIRDTGELFYVMRRVANSDPSRSKALAELLDKHPRLIVFYNFDYELDYIRALSGTLWQEKEIAFAEWNGHKHEEIPDTDKWLYAVQYAAGSEAWNCTTTNAIAFWSLTYSYKFWEQAHGRIDRMNTEYKDLYYYALRSRSTIDRMIWRSLKSKHHFQTDHFDMTDEEFMDFIAREREKE